MKRTCSLERMRVIALLPLLCGIALSLRTLCVEDVIVECGEYTTECTAAGPICTPLHLDITCSRAVLVSSEHKHNGLRKAHSPNRIPVHKQPMQGHSVSVRKVDVDPA